MSVRMHITKAKTGSRRAHLRLSAPRVTKAKGGVHLRHAMSPDGMYRGKQIIKKNAAAKKPAARKTTKKKTA